MESGQSFDLKLISSSFAHSKKGDGDIIVDHYIEGYTELTKFFSFFGTVFGFVTYDVNDKLGILRHHRQSGAGPNYITVQSLINYEVSNNLTKVKAKPLSGSRTLLRLHRALEFILLFMTMVKTATNEDKLSTVASEAYDKTLSKHHPWIVRKGVALALYTLPSRQQLLERMGYPEEEVPELMQQVITEAQPVYDIIQKMYKESNILDLP